VSARQLLLTKSGEFFSVSARQLLLTNQLFLLFFAEPFQQKNQNQTKTKMCDDATIYRKQVVLLYIVCCVSVYIYKTF
jgi:hypothetical protein